MLHTSPEHGKEHCSDCGAATISKCQLCMVDIRGLYHAPGVFDLTGGPAVPAFCHACGKPYPWTESRLRAARELAEELDGLTDEEKQTLKASLDDLVRDTPQTTVAATRFKRLVSKVGKGAADAFRDMLVDVLSEAAKKIVWPG